MEVIIISTILLSLLMFFTPLFKKPKPIECSIDLISVDIHENLGFSRTVNAYSDLTLNQKSAIHILQKYDSLDRFNVFCKEVKMSESEIKTILDKLNFKN